jgi:hypothetical protein
MDVIVYTDPTADTPYLRIASTGLDSLEVFATKYLDPDGTPYAIVDYSTIPSSPYINQSQTVDVSQDPPVFGWDLDYAKYLANSYNASYFQAQYNQGLVGLSISNDYQLNLAIATPENERTADQVAAVEFLSGLNQLQTSIEDQIAAATTGEEIISILSQLG